MTQRMMMRDTSGVEWLDRLDYQWEKVRRGVSEEAAGLEWGRITTTPGGARAKMFKDGMRVAWVMRLRTEMVREREHSKSVIGSGVELRPQVEAQQAFKELAAVGAEGA